MIDDTGSHWLCTHQQIIFDSHTICSKEYRTKATRRNKSIIVYQSGEKKEYGVVLKFVDYCSNGCTKHAAIIEVINILPTCLISDSVTNARLKHIHKCEKTKDIKLITLENILAPVVIITLEDMLYLVELPNTSEINL